MDLLCIGDLHLGRRPAHSSVAVAALDDPSAISPRRAWDACVEYAVHQRVSAVVLTGDVTEDARDFYGALGDFERGIRHLRGADIRVLAVAGNHDYTILPALAASVEGLEILGVGSTWQSVVVEGPDTSVELVGWSFTRERAAQPLRDPNELPARSNVNVPRLGILHCDRDVPDSLYAPVASSTLQACDVEGWLLGHIHKPDDLVSRGPNGYLGSVMGLDPTEDGPHGPWHLHVTSSGTLSMEQVLLAPLRWERLEVPVDGVAEAAALNAEIVAALGTLDDRIARESYVAPQVVGVRLQLTGHSSIRAELHQEFEDGSLQSNAIPVGDRLYFVDRYWLTARPTIDLEQRAQGDDPVGLLARHLLILDDPDSVERAEFVDRARRALDDHRSLPPFARLGDSGTSEGEVVAYLREAGMQALDELVAQEPETS